MIIRTSETDPLRIDTVEIPPGELGMTLCPGKQGQALDGSLWERDLESDFEVIARWDPSLIIGVMEPHEYQMLKVDGMAGAAESHGLRYETIAIPDGEPPGPAALQRWTELAPAAHGFLDVRGRLLIHCRGGLGRTGTLACMILIERGFSAADAIQAVRGARSGTIETERQEHFLAKYVPSVARINSEFLKACEDDNYRDAEAAFARWLYDHDMDGALAAAEHCSPHGAARILEALKVAQEANLLGDVSELEHVLQQRRGNAERPYSWRFFAIRLRQRVWELKRRHDPENAGPQPT